MTPKSKKAIGSAVVLCLILTALPFIGITQLEADNSNGTVLDFGYWNVKWTEMTFTEKMDGYDILNEACHIHGIEVVYDKDGKVVSVDGQANLKNKVWGMYVFTDGVWSPIAEPKEFIAKDHHLVCWARASSAEDVTPAVDYSGFTYYGYSSNGILKKTGEKLKIVSLAPSITETICAVNGTEMIVGTDQFSNYPAAIQQYKDEGKIKEVGGYSDPSYESIVSLHPNLVFCDGSVGQHISIADKLRKSGISCVVLYNNTDLDSIYLNLWIVASSIGISDNATKSIASIRSTIDTVSGISGTTNTRAFVALSTDPSPWTAGSATYLSDVIVHVGGQNVFASQSSSWFMVSKEQIYSKQPYVMIIISSTKITDESSYNALINDLDPVWKNTPAFQKGNIYVFSGKAADVISRPGPRVSEASEFIAKIFNPIAFQDEDPSDIIPKYICDDYGKYLKYQGAAS